MLRLGIVVVYVLGEEREPLLDLHLSRIERHTTVPYRIHGVATRTAARCRQVLERNPRVTLHDLPGTELRGAHEHSYYLEQLVGAALEGGASHVVSLHADSFPLCDGWVESLIERLSPSRVFATFESINTACLLFPRSFYLEYRPRFLPAPAEEASPAYQRYLRERAPNLHSGVGYGMRAWQNGLTWYDLPLSAGQASRGLAEPSGAQIYDDLVFHLKGAVRLSGIAPHRIPAALQAIGDARFESLLGAVRAVLPPGSRRALRQWLRRPLESLIDASRRQWQSEGMLTAFEQLLADPDACIEELRRRGVT